MPKDPTYDPSLDPRETEEPGLAELLDKGEERDRGVTAAIPEKPAKVEEPAEPPPLEPEPELPLEPVEEAVAFEPEAIARAKPPVRPAIVGLPMDVLATTGDRFIVRTQLEDAPEGEYFQETLTKKEIEERGGFVPPSGVKVSEVEAFAKKHGMSDKAAAETLTRFQNDPTRPEFAPLTTEEKQSLIDTAKPKVEVKLVEMIEGQPKVLITPVALKKLATIPRGTEEYFDAMKALRLIPKGREWTDPAMWDKALKALVPYITPDGAAYDWAEALKAGVPEAYLEVMIGKEGVSRIKGGEKSRAVALAHGELEPGVALVKRQLEDWRKMRIQLGEDKDGKRQWLLLTDWETIPRRFQRIGIRQGADKMSKAIEMAYKLATQALATYKLPFKEYPKGGMPFDFKPLTEAQYKEMGILPTYAILAAVRDKVARKHLDLLFGKGEVLKAEQLIKNLNTLNRYRGEDGFINIVEVLVNKDPREIRALKAVFADNPEAITKAEEFIREHYLTQWKEGDFKGIPYHISQYWRKKTPWQEDKGESLETAVAALIGDKVKEPKAGEELNRYHFGIDLPPFIQKDVDVTKWVKEGDKAFSDSAKWMDEVFLPGVMEVTELVNSMIGDKKGVPFEQKFGWDFPPHIKKTYTVPLYPEAEAVVKGVSMAIVYLMLTIPGLISGTGASALLHAGAGEKKEALIVPALLAAGMAAWMVGRPIAFKKDPYFEIPFTMALFKGAPLKRMAKIAKDAGVFFDPRQVANTSLALTADIARVKKPKTMSDMTARELLATQENIWAGKVPEGIKDLSRADQAMFTAFIKNRDTLLFDKEGNLQGRVTPFQMTTPSTAFHTTPNINPLLKEMKTKGYIEVQPTGTYGGMWFSQQLAQTFLVHGKMERVGGLMVRFSKKDLRDPPPQVMALEKFTDMKVMMEALAREGRLEPKLYTVFKWYGKDKKFELELFAAPGFKIRTTKARWYSPQVEGVTSLTTKSMLSYKEIPKERILEPIYKEAKAAKIVKTNVREKDGKLTGDVFDKEGNITKLAEAHWHPKAGGYVRRRVSAVVVDNAGRLLLTTDHLEPRGYYGLPGGSLKWEHLLPGADRISPFTAAYIQVMSEVGFGIKDMKRLPAYLGKMNRHSLPGSYVVRAKPESLKIDIGKYFRENPDMKRFPGEVPELKDAFWWDGKTKVGVSPGTFDIIVKLVKEGELKGIDITRLRISEKTPPELLTARGTGYYRPKDLRVGGIKQVQEFVRREVELHPGGEIRQGQNIPILIGATKNAKAEGLGVPTLPQLVGAKLLIPYVGLKKWAIWRWRLRAEAPERADVPIPTVSSWLTSSYTGLDLKAPKLTALKQRVIALLEKTKKDYLYDVSIKGRKKSEAFWEKWLIDLFQKRLDPLEARAVKNIKERVEKGEDYNIVFKEEMGKVLVDFSTYMETRITKHMARRAELERLEEAYARLPYKGTKGRRKVLAIDEVALKRIEPEARLAYMRATPKYKEYTPESALEYAIVYPGLYPEMYPKVAEPEPYPRVEPEPRFELRREPRPEPEPEPKPYPEPEPKPEPEPEPVPEPEPEPEPEPVPEKPPPPAITAPRTEEERKQLSKKGSIAWRQGMVTLKGVRVPVWYKIHFPYRSDRDVTIHFEPPPGAKGAPYKGKRSAYRSIQLLTGVAPDKLFIDMGIQDIHITEPAEPGKIGAIKFKSDPQEKTKGHIQLSGMQAVARRKKIVKKRRKKSKRSRYAFGNLPGVVSPR